MLPGVSLDFQSASWNPKNTSEMRWKGYGSVKMVWQLKYFVFSPISLEKNSQFDLRIFFTHGWWVQPPTSIGSNSGTILAVPMQLCAQRRKQETQKIKRFLRRIYETNMKQMKLFCQYHKRSCMTCQYVLFIIHIMLLNNQSLRCQVQSPW